jgi:hypothetical protein
MWGVPTSLRAKILELATLPFPPPYSPEIYAELGDADREAWRQRVRGATLEREAVLNARNGAHVKALHDHAERGLGGGELQFPSNVDRDDRAHLHELAEALGLWHESRGHGARRRLVVWAPHHGDYH